MDIKLIKSTFYNEQKTKDNLCDFIQQADQLSIGKYCKQFEELFARRQWRKHAILFNSWSSANLALIQTMLNMGTLKKWDAVWFSSLTRATNPMPLIQLGLVPVPIDVDIQTLNITRQTVQAAAKNTSMKAIFITNLLWWCADIDGIQSYCTDNNIILLEDNCESLWSVYKGKKLGNFSLASTFSTYVWHHMSTIEWGIVCTDDDDIADMLIMTRAHGRDRNLSADRQQKMRAKHHIDGFYSKYTFYTLWYNLRPHEITGFLWCEQLQYLDEIVSLREKNAKRFVNAINKNTDFYPLSIDHMEVFSNFAIPCVCKSPEILTQYIQTFASAGIEIRPIVGGDCTQQLFRKDLYGENKHNTTAQMIHQQGFYFGNSPEYTEDEIDFLLTFLNK